MGSGLWPTRRELTLLLFALSVFFAAYNFEAYVRPLENARSVAYDSASALSARALLALRAAGVPVLRKDGRRAPQFADTLEQEIVGDWDDSVRPSYSLGPGGVSEDQQHRDWSNGDVLVTELVAHVPGYTVFNNALLMEGTLYLVHDHAAQVFPKPEAVISHGVDSTSHPRVLQDLRFLTRHQALEILGYDAHRLTGTTVLSLDHASLIDNQTMLALHRAYASVAEYGPEGSFLAPARTLFANLKYADVAHSGYDLKLARLAFPYMAFLFADDFVDLERAGRPILFDRVLISDRTSAELSANGFDFATDAIAPLAISEPVNSKAGKGKEKTLVKTVIEATDKRLSFAPPFALPARADWAAPLRDGLLAMPGAASKARAVTYVSTQSHSGPRLREADHEALVKALKSLGSSNGWNVHVVEVGSTSWADAARAAAQSSVMLGVYGDALANAVLMLTSKATVIEFFPDGKFTNEREFVTRALGMEYVAWRNTKKYPRGSLPPISPPTLSDPKVLSIDVNAVVAFVKEQLGRRY